MQNNKSPEKISIHHLYSKTHQPIIQSIKQNPNPNIHPISIHTYPIVIHTPKQYPQYYQNKVPFTPSRNSPKKVINTSHYVVGDPVGFTHCNVLPPKFKPFQPGMSDVYTNLNSNSNGQSQVVNINPPINNKIRISNDNTKSSPVIDLVPPNININRSLQTLLTSNTMAMGIDVNKSKDNQTNTNTNTYKRKETQQNDEEIEKQKRIQNFFNQGMLLNCDQKIRNILKQHAQHLSKNQEDTLNKMYSQNISQSKKSLQEMKQILQELINTKKQELKQKQNNYIRHKKITSKLQSVLKNKNKNDSTQKV